MYGTNSYGVDHVFLPAAREKRQPSGLLSLEISQDIKVEWHHSRGPVALISNRKTRELIDVDCELSLTARSCLE